jgi:hypothetical protein
MRLLLLTIISTARQAQNRQSGKSAARWLAKDKQGVSLEVKSEIRGIGDILGTAVARERMPVWRASDFCTTQN